jgi:hypothetical protein
MRKIVTNKTYLSGIPVFPSHPLPGKQYAMKHPTPAARWAAALTTAFAMSQAAAATAHRATNEAKLRGGADHSLLHSASASGHQHYLADDAALLEGPQDLWGIG